MNEAAAQSGAISEIRGVLVPLQQGKLLLPNAAVAEVVGYLPPEALDGAPDWLLGQFVWRHRNVPVVSFERLHGEVFDAPGHRARIAVCHALDPYARRPYVGIVARGIPRLVRVTEDNLELLTDDYGPGEAVAARIELAGDEVWIPDLDRLESLVSDAF